MIYGRVTNGSLRLRRGEHVIEVKVSIEFGEARESFSGARMTFISVLSLLLWCHFGAISRIANYENGEQ